MIQTITDWMTELLISVNVYAKISNTFLLFLFSCEIVSYMYRGWNSQNACEMSKQGRSLIWVCAVCLGLFSKRLVFEIFEHLSYAIISDLHQIHVLYWAIEHKKIMRGSRKFCLPFSFVIFQGASGPPPPPSGSAHGKS